VTDALHTINPRIMAVWFLRSRTSIVALPCMHAQTLPGNLGSSVDLQGRRQVKQTGVDSMGGV